MKVQDPDKALYSIESLQQRALKGKGKRRYPLLFTQMTRAFSSGERDRESAQLCSLWSVIIRTDLLWEDKCSKSSSNCISLLLVETRKTFNDTILKIFLGSSLGVTGTITQRPMPVQVNSFYYIFNPYFLELPKKKKKKAYFLGWTGIAPRGLNWW